MADEENKEKKESEVEEGLDPNDEFADDEGDRKGKKKLLILIVLLVILLAGAAGAYFMGLFGGSSVDDMHALEPVQDHAAGAKPSAVDYKPIFYVLPSFVVNLNSGGKRVSFLKATITLELPNPEVAKKVDELQPRIEDSFNTYLREMRPSDLSGSAGIYRLREELMVRVNKTIYPDKVNDILFKDIIVQ